MFWKTFLILSYQPRLSRSNGLFLSRYTQQMKIYFINLSFKDNLFSACILLFAFIFTCLSHSHSHSIFRYTDPITHTAYIYSHMKQISVYFNHKASFIYFVNLLTSSEHTNIFKRITYSIILIYVCMFSTNINQL